MVKPLLTIITLLYCASSSAKSGSPPASTITFIAQIEHVELNKTALSHDMKLILADRFYFKTSNPCETNSISARPESMGITDKAYADKLRNLETPFLDDRYFFMTINQCDGNGSPMLTDIKVCTTELCGAEYTKKIPTVWLDETLKPTAKRLAIYFIQSPLPYDDKKKQWKVTGWYISSTDNPSSTKQIAFEGYTDTDNFSNSKFISSFQSWFENGQKEEEKHFDEQGQLNGLVKQWYKNGNLAKSQNYKHDILDGDSEEWYENGIPESLYPYKNGKTDGVAKSWNKYGKLTYSIEYKNGVENGVYRNWSKNTGKLTKETQYVNGIRQGVEKEFNDRTGKLLTATQYVNNKRNGTEETYDQNGIKYITCYQNDEELSSLYTPTQIKDNATKGNSSAQFTLGKYEFTCANIDEGIKWLTKSAEQKNTDAIYFLATAYKGNGIPANNEKYITYLQQAAMLGNSNAQAEIGYLYLIGKELPQNLPDAGVWFKKAAAQGNFVAHFYLERMYQNGDGVEKNMEKARFHLSNAAEGGIKPALKALNELEHQTK